jgi:hypothetical protein
VAAVRSAAATAGLAGDFQIVAFTITAGKPSVTPRNRRRPACAGLLPAGDRTL